MTRIFNAFVKIAYDLFQILFFGLKLAPFKNPLFYINTAAVLFLLYALLASGKYDALLKYMVGAPWNARLIHMLATIPILYQFMGIGLYGLTVYFFALGIRPYLDWKKYQRAIDCLALKSGIGLKPRLIRVKNDSSGHRLKLTILSEGVGLDRYETKKGDLESACGAVIEKMGYGGNPKFVEITLAKRRIPENCRYSELFAKLTKPYSFIVGESMGGPVVQSIRELPHMLIAGTTGGGKSVFFKQALLGLAQTSPHFQMYLLDLKNGIEMKEFAQLPNVVVAKNEKIAVNTLRRLKAEMERRFKYMEDKGYKKIEPERDKMDLIVVGVDEASVLYTKPGRKSLESDLIEEARSLTDSLAKLARAAGIHLVLATQKVSKETIDTKIQENIGGRMCFRMNTLQGSLTVLGNKAAFELSDRPGRAIWSTGSQFTEVQAPLIKDDEIVREIEVIRYEFENKKRENFQEMLTLDKGSPDKMLDPAMLTAA